METTQQGEKEKENENGKTQLTSISNKESKDLAPAETATDLNKTITDLDIEDPAPEPHNTPVPVSEPSAENNPAPNSTVVEIHNEDTITASEGELDTITPAQKENSVKSTEDPDDLILSDATAISEMVATIDLENQNLLSSLQLSQKANAEAQENTIVSHTTWLHREFKKTC